MRIRLVVCAVLLASCAAKSKTSTATPNAAVTASAKAADPELVAIADAVDPGEQAPLFDVLPAWLRDKVGASPGREVAVREIREALLAWDKMRPGSSESFMMSLLALGRGLILAERAVASGADDPELLLALSRTYAILGMQGLASESGMFQQILQYMAMMAARAQTAEAIDVGEVMTALREVFKRAPLLHRRTAAELLRRHGDHPEVPRVLGRLADDAMTGELFARALQLRTLSLARMGAAAKGGDHLDMAWTCFKALDVKCGEQALARGREVGSDRPDDAKAAATLKARVEFTAKLGEQARRLMALPTEVKPAEISVGLERGNLLMLLGHYAEARGLYESLQAAHPGDARPLTGLAKVMMTARGELTGGAKLIEQGRRLANHDHDYYEVALGVFGSKLLTEVMPAMLRADAGGKPREVVGPLLDDLKEYATGLKKFDEARGTVLLDLEAIVRKALPLVDGKRDDEVGPMAAGELMARTPVLAQKFPGSADVRRLVHLTATLTRDKATALALVKAPLAAELAGDAALQRARVQVWLDVVMLWDAVEEVPAVLAAARALPAGEGGWARVHLEAMALALHARATKDREAAIAAIKMFEEVAVDDATPNEGKMAAAISTAAIFTWFGDDEAARQRYELALSKDAKSEAGLVGIAALFIKHGVHEPKLMEVLDLAAVNADNVTLRVQAAAWRYTQAKQGVGDVEATRAAFIEIINKPRAGDIRGNLAVGRIGAFSRGSWNLSLQWQVTTGLQIINELTTTQCLMPPSPDIDELMALADAAKKKARPAMVGPGKSASPSK